MTNTEVSKYQKRIITIPNILSLFRLCLIPVIVWLYCYKKDYMMTAIVLVISGVTDVVDGFIARKFNMVSDFGKAFDPVADKLTQIVTLYCLVTRFELMIIPLIILVIKEALAGVLGLITIKRTKVVMGADWHGKVTTMLLYLTMFLHIILWEIPVIVSDILVLVCILMMFVSAFLYSARYIKALKKVSN